MLPISLEAATERMMRPESIAREESVLGHDFVNHYGGTRQHEVKLWNEAVTNWEGLSVHSKLICRCTTDLCSREIPRTRLIRKAWVGTSYMSVQHNGTICNMRKTGPYMAYIPLLRRQSRMHNMQQGIAFSLIPNLKRSRSVAISLDTDHSKPFNYIRQNRECNMMNNLKPMQRARLYLLASYIRISLANCTSFSIDRFSLRSSVHNDTVSSTIPPLGIYVDSQIWALDRTILIIYAIV